LLEGGNRLDIEQILSTIEGLKNYLIDCKYNVQPNYVDIEYPQTNFFELGEERLLALIECYDYDNIKKIKNHFLIDKGLTHCVILFKGKALFCRSYGERKYFTISNNTKNNPSKKDKVKNLSDDFDILFRTKDISGDFYEGFKLRRNSLVQHIENEINSVEKYLITQRIFDRIFFIYFLCHKGIIKLSNGDKIKGESLFDILLSKGDFFKNIYQVFEYLNTTEGENLKINSYDFFIPYLNGGLFRLDDKELKISLSMTNKDWKAIFSFLNSYHWIIEDDVDDVDEDERVLTPEILGHVYERSVVEWEKKGFENEVIDAVDSSERKSLGVYYTPGRITDYICKSTIIPFLLGKMDNKYQSKEQLINGDTKDITKAVEILEKIEILDPACGSGAFLIKAADLLFRLRSILMDKLNIRTSHYKTKLDIIVNNIFGVDILSGAVEITKLRLWLWLISSYEESEEIQSLPNIEYKIGTGNSLIGWLNEKINPNLSSPLTSEIHHIFKGLITNAIDNERKEFKIARDLLKGFNDNNSQGIDVKNYSKAYQILNNIYRRSHGDRATDLKEIIETIRNSIYSSVNPSFLAFTNQKINPKYYNKSSNIPIAPKDYDLMNPFNWNVDFYDQNDGFDVIIGNPPYVFGGNKGIKKAEKIFFKGMYNAGNNKVNLFALFIERAINLLKTGTRIAFILPNTLLRVTSYKEIRKIILENTRIEEIVDLPPGVFQGVTAATVIIVLYKESNKNNLVNNIIKISNEIEGKMNLKPQKELKNNAQFIFDLNVNENSFSNNDRFSGCVNLGKLCKELIFGVVITKNEKEVIFKERIDNKYKKFLEGKDIESYGINYSQKFLLYEKSKLHRPRSSEVFEVPEKILVQRISGGHRPLKAAYDEEQFYTKESINNIILEDKSVNVKYKYILALLNSSLLNWYYSTKFTNASKLTVNISKTFLSLLPIKVISFVEQQHIIDKVDKIMKLKKDLVNNKNLKCSREEIEKNIKNISLEIDDLIFNLYEINEKEREIIINYVDSHY
jgi:adenine-specific DNA-methyltransferase